MADFTDRIKLVVDMTADKATSGFQNLKQSVGEAEGGFGKLKAGAGGVFDAIGASAAGMAAGGAAAIAAFAKSAMGDFQSLAREAENFGATAGVGVEDASKWIEVSDDLGVSADSVAGAMQRLNREAASGQLSAFGITTQDANERLIQTIEHIDAIPNASDRAKAQFELFGKSGAALAPLIAHSSELRDRLAEVGDNAGKIITPEEAAKADQFRDAMDNLSDAFDNFKLQVGGDLVGALANFAEMVGTVYDKINGLIDLIPGLDGGIMGIVTGPLRNFSQGLDTLTSSSSSLTDRARGLGQTILGSIPGPLGTWAGNMLDVSSAQDDTKASADAVNETIKAQAEAAKEATDALNGLLSATLAQFNGQLALEDAGRKTNDAFTAYQLNVAGATASNWANKEATDKVATSLNDAEGAALKQAAAADALAKKNAELNGTQYDAAASAETQIGVLDALRQTLDPSDPLRRSLDGYISQLEVIPASKSTTILANTEQAEQTIRGYVANFLNALPKFLTTNIHANVSTSTSGAPAGAAPSSASTRALGASPLPSAPSVAPAASAGTVNNIYVSVAAAPLTHPAEVGRQVADYLDAFYRRNGTRLRAVP